MVFNFKESKACQCCGNEGKKNFAELSWEGIDFKWVICEQCSLVYMDPVPDKNSYLNFYKSFFWDHKAGRLKNLGEEQKLDKNEKHVKSRQADFATAIQQRRIPKIVSMLKQFTAIDSDTKVLEIGCAWGETLNYLNRHFGSKVFAVEPSDYAVEVLHENYPFIDIIGRTAEELYANNQYNGTMDAVIFSHVLENITDQNATLEMVHRLLSKDGLLYIDTCSLFWHKWPLNPYHPFVYTKETISSILIKHGFEIKSITCSTPPGLDIFSAIKDVLMEQDPYITLVARKIDTGSTTLQSESNFVDIDKICKQQKLGVLVLNRKSRIQRIRRRLLKKLGVSK